MLIRWNSPGTVASLLSESPTAVWDAVIDGHVYEMRRGSAGDHRFQWGDRAVFHLDPGGELLTCGLADPNDAGARRLLCDTVLWSVSLMRGYELLHAGAVCLDDVTICIVAASGVGKTSLLAELLRRDGELLSDDILALSRAGGHVVAHPGPPLMNLPLGALESMPSAVCDPIARLDNEAWVHVTPRAPAPRRLTTICLLDRTPGLATRLAHHPRTPLALLPHAPAFRSARERRRNRFELFGDLISDARMVRLTAGEDGSPGVLADIIASELTSPTWQTQTA